MKDLVWVVGKRHYGGHALLFGCHFEQLVQEPLVAQVHAVKDTNGNHGMAVLTLAAVDRQQVEFAQSVDAVDQSHGLVGESTLSWVSYFWVAGRRSGLGPGLILAFEFQQLGLHPELFAGGQPVDEEYALEVVDLMLDDPGQPAIAF